MIHTNHQFRRPHIVECLTMRPILLCLLLVFSGCEDAGQTVNSSELYVVDGDTVKLDGLSYRLIGFDTPETYRSQCDAERALGNRAARRLRELINSVPTVKLVIEPRLEKYGRGLARLYVDGTDVGKTLIGESLARDYNGGKRQSWCQP